MRCSPSRSKQTLAAVDVKMLDHFIVEQYRDRSSGE
jgi:hypothetical protein